MEYIGEHPLPGNLGYLLVIIAFVSALASALGYFLAEKGKSGFEKIGRAGFIIHAVSVFSVVGTLFYIISQHYFEYNYVWSHSSMSMPMRYIFSCFWEGQEGSFLLWMFWHSVIGLVLIKKAKNWEFPVMTIFALVQVVLASMIMGVYLGDLKIGSSPFILIRELPEYLNLPFTQNPNYLSLPNFADGRGLNPLLQNYWMTIHPPTLFLGFALTLIPFAYAIAGLWRKDFTGWAKPALAWTFAGVMVLGTGILMGGAWAYEALSFGGFWAWDPVENSSLVPWLVLVAGAHLLLLVRNRKKAVMAAFIFNLLSFILVLYSTFLTRSGVLGDSSVHAFVDLGLNGQLLVYLFMFLGLALVLFLARMKDIPRSKDDDPLWSREFWMFMGALVLFLSGIQIIFTTSIPVINKVFGTSMAPPVDPISHYNGWQLPFAIIVSVMIAVSQFLKYKDSKIKEVAKKLSLSLVLALVVTGIFSWALSMTHALYNALLAASLFAAFSNLDYFLRVVKGQIKNAGSSLAHIGFALVLAGALVSTGNQKVISQNETYIAEDFPVNEHILLNYKDTLKMGPYQVSWMDQYQEGVNRYYEVAYFKESASGKLEESFRLQPFIQMNKTMGNVAEPSTKHYWNRDVYTHITYAELPEDGKKDPMEEQWGNESELKFTPNKVDSVIYAQSFIILDSLSTRGVSGNANSLSVKAHLKVVNMLGEKSYAEPVYEIENNFVRSIEDSLQSSPSIKFKFENIDANQGIITIKAWEEKRPEDQFIVMKAIVFPYINILWLGCILLFLGTFLAVIQRFRKA